MNDFQTDVPTLLGSGIRRILDLKIRVQQNQQNHRASRCKCSCGLSQIQGRPTCSSAHVLLWISALIKGTFQHLWENIWTHSSWSANTTARKQKHGGSRSPLSVLIQAFRQRCDIWKENSEQQENGLYYTAESQREDRKYTTSTATKLKYNSLEGLKLTFTQHALLHVSSETIMLVQTGTQKHQILFRVASRPRSNIYRCDIQTRRQDTYSRVSDDRIRHLNPKQDVSDHSL